MIISWIIYFATVLLASVFFLLYKDLLSLILFLTVLCIPVILLVINLVSFLLAKIEVEINETGSGISKPIKILVKVTNRSPFAITHVKLLAKFRNLFLNTEYSCEFVINSAPFSSKKFTYELKSEHIGNIDFSIKKAEIYDFFSLWKFSKHLGVSKIIPIYPETVGVSSTIRPNNFFIGEADKFSKAKAGDDPSEIFNIREYTEGDKLNKIHWKLTSKTDKCLVKEYSLPVSDNIFIYLDLKIPDFSDESVKLVNSLIKTYTSVSLDFAEKGISHYVGWYDIRKNSFVKAKVTTKADVFLALKKIFSSSVFASETMLENCDFFLKSKYSHIILMSSNSVTEVESLFTAFDLSLSLISIVSFGIGRYEVPTDAETRYISVIPDTEEQCLYGITF